MRKLEGKIAVITGGTRGIGLGIAQAFVREGAAVVVTSRSQKSVDEAIRLIQSQGGQVSGIAVDVTDLEQVEMLARHAATHFGGLNIWVNNAGTAGPYGPTIALSPQDFTQVVQTNILGVYHGSRVAMQFFLSQGSGKLINLLGHGYRRPVPWQNAYASSKAWVRSFTRALAEETKQSGVGVYAFDPGMVLTELLTQVDVIEGSQDRLKVFPTILRMWAKPAEIPAQKAVWIASAATDGKTGLLISIFSPWLMLGGAVKEGLRTFLRRPAPPLDIQVNVVPADHRRMDSA